MYTIVYLLLHCRLQKDHFYDFDQAELDKKISEDKKKLQSRQSKIPRVTILLSVSPGM